MKFNSMKKEKFEDKVGPSNWQWCLVTAKNGQIEWYCIKTYQKTSQMHASPHDLAIQYAQMGTIALAAHL